MVPPLTDFQQTSDYDESAQVKRDFFRRVIVALDEGEVPFLVGGAYAFARYTGIKRKTKDFDVFLRPETLDRALAVLAAAGFETEPRFPHWLAKAGEEGNFVDLIFSSGNGVARVDDGWFEHAVPGEILAVPVRLTPAEEMLWSKAFVQERERYDGADVIHLLHARGRHLDWPRLLGRFGDYWRVLFSFLVQYGFIYPGEELPCPPEVMRELVRRLETELAEPPGRERICRGTLVSREQYLVDTLERGYADGRQEPWGNLSRGEIASWTEAIWRDHAPE